jgi:hypothetical protein
VAVGRGVGLRVVVVVIVFLGSPLSGTLVLCLFSGTLKVGSGFSSVGRQDGSTVGLRFRRESEIH